jgi:hypothetical protein
MDKFDFIIEDFDTDEGIRDIRVNCSIDYSEEEYQITIDTVDEWREYPEWWLEWSESEWVKHNAWLLEKAEEEYKRSKRHDDSY